MPLTIPPELKKITPYVRRAEELDRDKGNPESRLVSYFCRQYAVHTGISFATSPSGKNCLRELLEALEGEKEAMDSFTRDESKYLCSEFAKKIFDKADQEDRSGKANRNTARTFYAAASFLEILQQFYLDNDNSEEVTEQKKKSVYCKWKATEILKAIKEGRTPTPGGYGEENNSGLGENNDSKEEDEAAAAATEPEKKSPVPPSPPVVEETVEDTNEKTDEEPELKMSIDDDIEGSGNEEGTEVKLGPPPAYPLGIEPVEPHLLPPAPPMAPPMNIPKPPMTFNLPPPAPTAIPPPVVPKQPKVEKPKRSIYGINIKKKKNKKASKTEIADATELARFALAALEDKDADLAAQRLQQALQVLGR